MDTNKRHYCKPAVPLCSLVHKLEKRGLAIQNKEYAVHALTFIGYFRLRGYCYPFYKMTKDRKPLPISPKTFLLNTSFEDIVSLYEFDRKMRLLIIEEIQQIEVGLRTCISEHMSIKYGPHWFMNLSVLRPSFQYEGLRSRIKEAKELFITHYYENYQSPALPPSWMVTEVLTFGAWSRLYADLFLSDQKAIAKRFLVKSPDVLCSWFHCLSHLRNLCAHHNRVWNRNFYAFMPKTTGELQDHMLRKNTLYSRLCIIKFLSDKASFSTDFSERLMMLISNAPKIVTLEQMGFLENWSKTELWNIKNSSLG